MRRRTVNEQAIKLTFSFEKGLWTSMVTQTEKWELQGDPTIVERIANMLRGQEGMIRENYGLPSSPTEGRFGGRLTVIQTNLCRLFGPLDNLGPLAQYVADISAEHDCVIKLGVSPHTGTITLTAFLDSSEDTRPCTAVG